LVDEQPPALATQLRAEQVDFPHDPLEVADIGDALAVRRKSG
jgi:hypothetical protein